MRAARLVTILCLVSGALAACSLVLDFDALLPLPPTSDAASIADAREEDVVEAGIVCNAGFANCDEDAAVCETFIAGSDDKNCGACMRSCGGATCSSGICAPIVLAKGEESPSAIATDGEWVYWATGANADAGIVATIARALPDGGSRSVLTPEPQRVAAIAVDETHVYWATIQGSVNYVRRMVKGGGAVEPVSSEKARATELAVTKANVVWTTKDSPLGAVYSAPKSGADASVIAPNQAVPHGIASDGTKVFWATTTNNQINQALLDGSGLASIESKGQPNELTTDGKRVYWTTVTNPFGLYAVESSFQSTFTTLATFGAAAYGIVVDDKNVYWATANAIQRMPKDGSSKPVTLAAISAGAAREIAVDDENVYFTVPFTGFVLKTPK
jgi:hypothetical protein